MYDFQAGSLLIDQDGDLNTPEWKFSREASASQTAQAEAQQPEVQSQAKASQRSPASADNDDEHDAVPKTGENKPVIWPLCLAALCMFGSIGLRKADK